MAAEFATEEKIAFFVRHTSGLICAPITDELADRLDLPLMVSDNTEAMRTAFTVSIDVIEGTSSGISAGDRALTLQRIVDPDADAERLRSSGPHLPPSSQARWGLEAGWPHRGRGRSRPPRWSSRKAGVLCEVVNDDGTMARVPDLAKFAKEHGLVFISIADLVRHRRRTEKLVTRLAEATIPTPHGDFTAVVYESELDGEQHVAFVRGDVATEPDVLGAGALRMPDRRHLWFSAL